MLRLSSYFILSDRLQNGGYALLNGLTGTIEFLNGKLYKKFKQMTLDGDPHELYVDKNDFPDSMIETYLRRGHFTEISHADERRILEEIAAALHKRETAYPSFVIVPELDCNYRCIYCFEKPLQTKLNHGKTKMTFGEADAVYKAIDKMSQETGSQPERITLFGGEPLILGNMDIVFYIVNEGAKRGMRFSAVTNGHDLYAFTELFTEDKINHIQITVDGPKDIHDSRRISLDGSSSFDRIIGNMRRTIAETGVSIGLRVNLDKDNYRYFEELIQVFDQEKWLNNDRIFINAAIVAQRDASGAAFPAHDINKVRAELLGLVNKYSNVEIGCAQSHQSNALLSSLMAGKAYSLRSSYCGASCGMYVFLPGGKISCCWESVGEEYGCIGSYSENGLVLDEKKAGQFFGRSAAKIPQCADCKYCLVCSGGCPQYAQFAYNDIYKPYCGDFPETYAWVLADAVENFLKTNGL